MVAEPLKICRTILLVELKMITDVSPCIVVAGDVVVQLHGIESSSSSLLNGAVVCRLAKGLRGCVRRCANGLPYDAYEGAGRKVPRTDSSRTYLLGRDCGQAPSAEVGAIATSEQRGAPNTSIFQSSPARPQPATITHAQRQASIRPCIECMGCW